MNAHAATSSQKSAIPSKRAAIHALASTAGANHAKSHPAIRAAARARGVSSPRSCQARSATSAALPICSSTLTRCQPNGSRRQLRVQREARHRQRPVLIGRRAHTRDEHLAHAAQRPADTVAAVERVQQAEVVAEESRPQHRPVQDQRRRRRHAEHHPMPPLQPLHRVHSSRWALTPACDKMWHPPETLICVTLAAIGRAPV